MIWFGAGYINAHPERYGMRLEYSTPSRYFDALAELQRRNVHVWPLYTGDFLPYANNEDCYWNGYYSTRPALKADVRQTESLLAAAQTALSLYLLEASARTDTERMPSCQDHGSGLHDKLSALELARQHVALLQHHDGITVRCLLLIMRAPCSLF
jgi:hypothetical protein